MQIASEALKIDILSIHYYGLQPTVVKISFRLVSLHSKNVTTC